MPQSFKILFLSVPAFPYHIQSANSVCDRVHILTEELERQGHQCDVLGGVGSEEKPGVIIVGGHLQPDMATASKNECLFSHGSTLMHMLDYARQHQDEYDAIIATGQDYASYWSQPFFKTPFLLLPNLCKSLPEIDEMLYARAKEHPPMVAFLTQAQKKIITKELEEPVYLKSKILKKQIEKKISSEEVSAPSTQLSAKTDSPIVWEPLRIDRYPYFETEIDTQSIFWAGRITRSKGIHHIAEVARRLGRKLILAGKNEDPGYLEEISQITPLEYLGIISRDELMQRMAKNEVFFQMQNPEWAEAFGRVTAEAMLSGCPVVAFECGANSELIAPKCGKIVADIDEAVKAFQEARHYNREYIRQYAEKSFSPENHGTRVAQWVEQAALYWAQHLKNQSDPHNHFEKSGKTLQVPERKKNKS